jgi:hypothetical protein
MEICFFKKTWMVSTAELVLRVIDHFLRVQSSFRLMSSRYGLTSYRILTFLRVLSDGFLKICFVTDGVMSNLPAYYISKLQWKAPLERAAKTMAEDRNKLIEDLL